MPADASIYQNFLRAPKSVQDYDNEAMQAQQNALALQNAKIQQNALQQQQADSATYRNALKGFGSDATANYNTLIRAGLGAQAEAYKKNATDQEKVKADADKARFDAAAKKIDIAGQAFNYVRLNPTLDNANAVIDYLGQNGIYSPEQVAQYKAQVQQNPDGIGNLAEMAFRSALNTKEQLANIQTRNLGGTTDTLSIDPVTGATKTVNSVRNTVSPGDLLQAETTRRGQNMVDARAKEGNSLKAAEIQAGGKPPPGYRWKGDGTLEAIPGGPGDKLPESQQKQVIGTQNLSNAIREYRDALKTFGPLDAAKPDQRATMGTKYNNMMLQAKEAYNLGVLNGPDFDILQSVVTDPRSIKGVITSNKALDTQAAELDRIMSGVAQTSSQLKPRGGATQTSGQAPKAGTIEDGHRFKGGDPSNPSNWEKVK